MNIHRERAEEIADRIDDLLDEMKNTNDEYQVQVCTTTIATIVPIAQLHATLYAADMARIHAKGALYPSYVADQELTD